MKENWKTIKDFPAYEVSDLGRVRRAAGGETRGTNAKGGILKQGQSHKGYSMVWLSMFSKKHTKAVHILVAKAFIPNPKGLPQVNHVDGIKAHCEASNLEWQNQLGNMQHSAKLGLHGDGVNFNKRARKWIASFFPESRRRVHLGSFATKAEALLARAKAISTV